jgi:DNA-binding transcriptional LysR family regulator
LQTGQLVSVMGDYTPPELSLYLLYPPSRQLSSRIRLLVDFLHERFGETPLWDLVD